MTGIVYVIFALGIAIAYVNGANDISKGIATLVGSGMTSYRRAVLWGTLWTGAGGITGAFIARAMVQTFGKGLLSPGTHATLIAAAATIAGAALWVGVATRKGLPVSTTHAIVGSVVGVAWLAYGFGGVNWSALGGKIVLPLLLSPVISLLATVAILRAWHALAPNSAADCLCVEIVQPPSVFAGEHAVAYSPISLPQLHVAGCTASQSASWGISIDHLHWLTSGATSFARGLNDAPKMVAIVLAASTLTGSGAVVPLVFFIAVTAGMVTGSWVAGRRVTEVLACEVTPMNHREGFVANLVTAVLVGPGAAFGLPMSTTHVASGAIMGVASRHEAGANRKTIRHLLLAWVITLPGAALLGIVAFIALRGLSGH